MNEMNLNSNLSPIKSLLNEMTKAYERIENAPVGFSQGLLNLGLIKKVNNRDIALTKRIPLIISKLANVIGMKEVYKEIEKYNDDRVREKCIQVLRVRQDEFFGHIENTSREFVIDEIMRKIEIMTSLVKKDYIMKKGRKWIRIDSKDGRGWLMVNVNTGDIHRLLGYGKVDPNDCIGNIFKLNAEEIINY
jgi:hypothetical protein